MATLTILIGLTSGATPAAASTDQFECQFQVHPDGSIESQWSDEPSATSRYVIERRVFNNYHWRARVGLGVDSFSDSPAPTTASNVSYRLKALNGAGSVLATADCTLTNSPDVSCEVTKLANGSYFVLQTGETQLGDMVVHRRVSKTGPFYWRARVTSRALNDAASPTGSASYRLVSRHNGVITAINDCSNSEQPPPPLPPSSCRYLNEIPIGAEPLEAAGSPGADWMLAGDGNYYLITVEDHFRWPQTRELRRWDPATETVIPHAILDTTGNMVLTNNWGNLVLETASGFVVVRANGSTLSIQVPGVVKTLGYPVRDGKAYFGLISDDDTSIWTVDSLGQTNKVTDLIEPMEIYRAYGNAVLEGSLLYYTGSVDHGETSYSSAIELDTGKVLRTNRLSQLLDSSPGLDGEVTSMVSVGDHDLLLTMTAATGSQYAHVSLDTGRVTSGLVPHDRHGWAKVVRNAQGTILIYTQGLNFGDTQVRIYDPAERAVTSTFDTGSYAPLTTYTDDDGMLYFETHVVDDYYSLAYDPVSDQVRTIDTGLGGDGPEAMGMGPGGFWVYEDSHTYLYSKCY